jgi:hypothetical protein
MAVGSGVTMVGVLRVVFREMFGMMLGKMLFAVVFPLPGLGGRGESQRDDGNGEQDQEFFHEGKDCVSGAEVTTGAVADQQVSPTSNR